MLISGVGAAVSSLGRSTNATHFQDDTNEGFIWIHVRGDTFLGRFYDKHGIMSFERTFTRPP